MTFLMWIIEQAEAAGTESIVETPYRNYETDFGELVRDTYEQLTMQQRLYVCLAGIAGHN